MRSCCWYSAMIGRKEGGELSSLFGIDGEWVDVEC